MMNKRSLEFSGLQNSNPEVKKQKFTDDKKRDRSEKINESILINPALEKKIEVNVKRLSTLQTKENLKQCFMNPVLNIESPGLFNFTNCGQIPHVTADLASTNNLMGEVSIISLQSVINHPGPEVLEKLDMSLSVYMKISDKIIITPFNSSDPTDLTRFNDQLGVSVWGKSGRKKITSKDFLHFIKIAKPEMFVSMSDVVPATVSKKRADKSCYRTLNWLNEAITSIAHSIKKSAILVPIPGSGHKDLMMKSASILSTRDVFGYVIERCTLPTHNWQGLVSDIISILPSSRPVVMLGVLNEYEMVEAYFCGCHFVDSSFVAHFSNTGHALTLNIKEPVKLQELTENQGGNTAEMSSDFGPNLAVYIPQQDHASHVKINIDNGKVSIFRPNHYIPSDVPFILDLTLPKFALQFLPIEEGCKCFSCVNYTQGYINHLLITKELLAPTLLMLHNLHHVKELVKQVKNCLQQGNLIQYIKKFRTIFSIAV